MCDLGESHEKSLAPNKNNRSVWKVSTILEKDDSVWRCEFLCAACCV